MIYRTDYHTHTKYSDGHGSPEDYIPFAIKEGLSELGFSDHLTLTSKQHDWSINPGLLEQYVREITALKNSCNGISLKIGLEVDYLPGKEEDIKSIINSLPLDYVIGSVHFMGDETVDVGHSFYQEKNLKVLYQEYFDLVGDAASSGLFDIIGHPDLIRIFRFFPEENLEPRYRKLARIIKMSNAAIEVNTNGMNKPLKDFYPDPSFLYLFKEEGVPVCVNSDAHRPSHVGQHFDQAYSLLLRAGYRAMVTYEGRKRSFKNIG